VIPFWFSFLLPITIIYLIFQALFGLCCKKKAKEHKPFPVLSNVEGPDPNKETREFDLILFGATGFTGNFAAEYLALNYTLGRNSESSNVKHFPF
jgi:hypothetical protein